MTTQVDRMDARATLVMMQAELTIDKGRLRAERDTKAPLSDQYARLSVQMLLIKQRIKALDIAIAALP